jgi:hypothetical protein
MPRFNRHGSSLLVVGFAAICAAVACGNSEDDGSPGTPQGGSSNASGASGAAGKVTGGSAGSNSGGSNNGGSAGSSTTAGKPSMSGSAGQPSAGTGNTEGGTAGTPGEGDGGTPSDAGAPGGNDDPRPGCAKVPGIELSNLHLIEGAGPGETAKLEIDVKNGTDEFVSYNPLTIKCTGDAVKSADDQLSVFGVSEGGMSTVELWVTFKDDAATGDVASCTVRGYIIGKSPEDCQNAQTMQLDVTVE